MIDYNINSDNNTALVSGDFLARTKKAVKRRLCRFSEVVKVLIVTHPAYSSRVAWL